MLAVLLLAGCKHEDVSFSFNSQAEMPTSDSKTYLVNEHWIYWDASDQISVASDQTASPAQGTLRSGENTTDALFQVSLPSNSTKFCALFPYNTDHIINYSGGSFTVKCKFPTSQVFRDDFTFGISDCPMVAYEEAIGGNLSDSMLFHSLCGIARIQFFSSIDETHVIKSIRV